MLQNDILFKLLMRVRMKLLNLKEVHTYYHQRISNHKKLGSSHIHTSEKLSWLTKSSYFRLIDFTLTYYVRCNHFSQNIIQREMSLNPGGMLKFNNTYLHAYLLFGEVVDFVSRFFYWKSQKKRYVNWCLPIVHFFAFGWMLSATWRPVVGNGCSVVNQFQA